MIVLKRFIKKYKEDILLCIGALIAGTVSFVVTLNVYPKIRYEKVNYITKENEEIVENFEPILDSGEVQEDILIIPVFEKFEESEGEVQEEIQEVICEMETSKLEEAFAIKKNISFILPLSGDILKSFAMDSLVYSETLNEWCTHSGIDIAGNIGDAIVASEDGVIESVCEDDKYGKTIVISHENGYKTVYSFVEAKNIIEKDKKVKKGEIIAYLVECTGFEAKDIPHLHFEMLKNGTSISPLTEIK